MIRVCPKRDAACPHGMDCPYSIDRYHCAQEPKEPPKPRPTPPPVAEDVVVDRGGVAETVAPEVERLVKRLKLWFFRDLNDRLRLKLFRLTEYPLPNDATLDRQQACFDHLLSALDPAADRLAALQAQLDRLTEPFRTEPVDKALDELAVKFAVAAMFEGSERNVDELREELKRDMLRTAVELARPYLNRAEASSASLRQMREERDAALAVLELLWDMHGRFGDTNRNKADAYNVFIGDPKANAIWQAARAVLAKTRNIEGARTLATGEAE